MLPSEDPIVALDTREGRATNVYLSQLVAVKLARVGARNEVDLRLRVNSFGDAWLTLTSVSEELMARLRVKVLHDSFDRTHRLVPASYDQLKRTETVVWGPPDDFT